MERLGSFVTSRPSTRLSSLPHGLIPQRLTRMNAGPIVDVRAHLVAAGDLVELGFGHADVFDEQLEAGRPPPFVRFDERARLVAGQTLIPDVDAREMCRSREAALDELEIVAHALHRALDLLVFVAGRHAFDGAPLPSQFAGDDVVLPLDVP